jgi:hypothetical protein
MSIYPDWIGVDVCTGATTLVDGYDIVIEELQYDVELEQDFLVELEDQTYEVEYGC